MSDAQEHRFQQALDYAGDTDRRLPGEDDSSQDRDDALHWAQVYKELAEFKEGVLEAARRNGREIAGPAGAEVHNDVVILEAELRRLEDRRSFWRARADELSR